MVWVGESDMRTMTKAIAVATLAAAAVTMAVPASAATFANFTMSSGRDNLKWTKTGALAGSLDSTLPNGTLGAANVRFNFLDPLLGITNAKAMLSLTATMAGSAASGGGGGVGDPLDQPAVAGSFTFTYNGPAYVDGYGHAHSPGDTLLSGVFSMADITSDIGSSSASVLDSTATPGHSITYTSDWLKIGRAHV